MLDQPAADNYTRPVVDGSPYFSVCRQGPMNKRQDTKPVLFAVVMILTAASASAQDPDLLEPWRSGVKIQPVAPELARHVIHA